MKINPFTFKEIIRVLIVEDSPVHAILLDHMLQEPPTKYDFYITICTTLKDAFERLDRSNFDVAFLDLNLPDMEGLASLSALHSHAPELPIIIYSGMDEIGFAEDAKKCGAKEYIVKGKATSHRLKLAIEKVLANVKEVA